MNKNNSKFESKYKFSLAKKQIYFLVVIFCFSKLCSQAPGGVSAGLQTWVKANTGLTGTTPVTAWANQVTTGTAVVVNGAPNLITTSTSYNYNPFIDFTAPVAPRQFLSLSGFNNLSGIDYRALFFAGHLTNLTRVNTHLATVNGVSAATPANGTLVGGNNGAVAALHFVAYDADFQASGTWRRNGAIVSYTSNHLSTKNILTAISLNNSPTILNRFLGGQDNLASFQGHTRDWRGPSAEIIAYTSSVSAFDAQKIESYLAVKYGVTLPINYLSTTGSIIYNTTGSYTNNIIGIGRDDAEALTQKQSHQNDDTVRVYINNVFASNLANVGAFSNNVAYIIMGSDLGKMCSSNGSNSEMPASCGLNSRIEREWKITNTNLSQIFNIDITLNTCAQPNLVNVADLVLLVDDDGNFGTGTTNCYFNGDGTGLIFSYTNPVITIRNISNVHLASGVTRFITIASKNSLTPLPIELLNFKGNCNELTNTYEITWTTATEKSNDYFTIEKSKDFTNWQKISKVKGAGNSSNLKNYTYIDTELEPAITYYRLKQFDFDGTETVYKNYIYNSGCGKKNGIVEFYPNPATKTITIKNVSEYKYYKIVNSLGQLIKQSELIEATIDVGYLLEGIYYLQLIVERNNTFTKKLTIIPNVN